MAHIDEPHLVKVWVSMIGRRVTATVRFGPGRSQFVTA